MMYLVKHGNTTIGPLSSDHLELFVRRGEVKLSDIVQSQEMSADEWTSVGHVIKSALLKATNEVSAAPTLRPKMPLFFNLHWTVVLLGNYLSAFFWPLQLSNLLWTCLMGSWARDLDGSHSKPMFAVAALSTLSAVFALMMMANVHGIPRELVEFLAVIGALADQIEIFKIRSAMLDYYNLVENYGLRLNGILTFLLSTTYLQYKINQIAKRQKASISAAVAQPGATG